MIAWIRIAVFLGALIAPLLALHLRDDALANEKRNAATLGSTGDATIPLATQIDAYVRDRFGLRPTLIALHRRLFLGLLHESPTDRVVLGHGGHLVYTARDDGIDITDFAGRWPYDPATIASWVAWQRDFQTRLAAQGHAYVMTVAPNKQTIYPEIVPARFGPHTAGMIDAFFAAASAVPDLAAVDVRPILIEHRGEDLYFHSDSHWNPLGALYAAQRMMDRVRPAVPGLHSLARENYAISRTRIDTGDLANMIGAYRPLGEPTPMLTRKHGPRAEPLAPNPEELVFEEPPHGPRCLLLGDSFGAMLSRRLADACGRMRFVNVWRLCPKGQALFDYVDDLVAEESPDVVIFEVAERYLFHVAP